MRTERKHKIKLNTHHSTKNYFLSGKITIKELQDQEDTLESVALGKHHHLVKKRSQTEYNVNQNKVIQCA